MRVGVVILHGTRLQILLRSTGCYGFQYHPVAKFPIHPTRTTEKFGRGTGELQKPMTGKSLSTRAKSIRKAGHKYKSKWRVPLLISLKCSQLSLLKSRLMFQFDRFQDLEEEYNRSSPPEGKFVLELYHPQFDEEVMLSDTEDDIISDHVQPHSSVLYILDFAEMTLTNPGNGSSHVQGAGYNLGRLEVRRRPQTYSTFVEWSYLDDFSPQFTKAKMYVSISNLILKEILQFTMYF